jgi:CheY-like chemotaxis protein
MMNKDILVLDPEPLVCSVINSILTREGYTVRTCSDLNQAIEAVRSSPPDLLLINIHILAQPGTRRLSTSGRPAGGASAWWPASLRTSASEGGG